MKFSLLVLGAPYSNQSVSTALRYAHAVIEQGHELYRVFFYHDAVNTANELITPPQDEPNLPQQWQQLAQQHQVDLVVCIASALKRGTINASEAQRYDKRSDNLLADFDISGLGQWIEAMAVSDRVVSFGP